MEVEGMPAQGEGIPLLDGDGAPVQGEIIELPHKGEGFGVAHQFESGEAGAAASRCWRSGRAPCGDLITR